ncbi:N-acetylmannosamine-6-phosphate 2-epimerase [Psychromonas sp. CNPT3]|uniref:N-acetylmannosamine-6-phosphate 2-epimerase n=1 Tax=Psychromonas sp. CNPT3 TaxID=314282 RepID=UPI00006E5083|nr:N-acetylmannosamine-6-phosphate 2-epimerase [Psychromonas sp. CNPT3]AGH82468.1 N-acetylmannosamine-6-phosphate 2-epimerase [Psychromonas sp. CNPT3]
MKDNSACLIALQQSFVASCQPVDFGPMDDPRIVSAMAQACINGGASALRIEGIENIKAVRAHVDVPIIGIIKRDLKDSAVRITPFIEDVIALKEAGANIIAIDATHRPRPTSVATLIKEIHAQGCLVMADCSDFEDGERSHQLGADIIGTTLSGYTGKVIPIVPDFSLVTRFSEQGYFVMAEGRYNSPGLAKQAMQAGASCVTVGSAITRIEHICGWFKDQVQLGRITPCGDGQ